MAESEQIWRAYVKIENIAEIYSARMDSNTQPDSWCGMFRLHNFDSMIIQTYKITNFWENLIAITYKKNFDCFKEN